MVRKSLSIGLIGSGFIARCHVFGYRQMPVAFPGVAAVPRLEIVSDVTTDLAERAADQFGFARSTSDWRKVVSDPKVDIVDICVPSQLHREIALAAIAAGKIVYCEKPVGLSSAQAREMGLAAQAAGLKSLVGFTYMRNPLMRLAAEIVADGTIGDVVSFAGVHNEDYMSDPDAPFSWRCDASIAGKAGALGDLGCHIISIARMLTGEIAEVNCDLRTVYKRRKLPDGKLREVENEDEANALIHFKSGARGTIASSRIATGAKMRVGFDLVGTKGALRFDGERLGELQLYTRDGDGGRWGFKTIYAAPSHLPGGVLLPGPAHGISFNDLKTIEIRDLMQLALGEANPGPDLQDAARIGAIVDAMLESGASREWVKPQF
ncbi:MAG: Gfo/Idh/MocA family oxidoreductase [Hyphomicrobiales bacterium]